MSVCGHAYHCSAAFSQPELGGDNFLLPRNVTILISMYLWNIFSMHLPHGIKNWLSHVSYESIQCHIYLPKKTQTKKKTLKQRGQLLCVASFGPDCPSRSIKKKKTLYSAFKFLQGHSSQISRGSQGSHQPVSHVKWVEGTQIVLDKRFTASSLYKSGEEKKKLHYRRKVEETLAWLRLSYLFNCHLWEVKRYQLH